MHSRIFQISREKPIEKDDYLDEDDLYPCDYCSSAFVGNVADYVSAFGDADKDEIEWLKSAYGIDGGLEVNAENRTITIVNKEVYFKNKFDKLKELTDRLNSLSLSQFSLTALGEDAEHRDCSFYTIRYEIDELLNGDKWGMYFYEDGCYDTVDEVIRGCANGEVLYIGQVFDYHS